ncbi:MAG: hypothetical protein P1V34_02665 [Alphaproteobacteria bacterium]|nr:hypothetical protein [Alphaproteobacteria bacterium]
MKPRRRKIRMDRGDTLGGTVPLLLRDSITANGTSGRFLHKDRRSGPGWRSWLVFLGILLFGAIIVWFTLPELVSNLGLPTSADIWQRIQTFFSVPDA